MPKFLLRKIVFIPLLLLLFAGLYALAGFWLAPKLIRAQATDYVRTEMGKELRLGEIRSNPFTFELHIRDAAIVDGQQPLLSFRHLYVDFQAASLWKGAYTFREVLVEEPFARAIIRGDGSLNLADLLPKESSDAPIPSVWIEGLAVTRGQVNFADNSRRLKPEKILSPISFALRDFRTTPEGGGFTLDALSEQGEGFRWQGQVALQPVASRGKFTVKGFKARSAYEFFSDDLPFELSAGQVDLEGSYDFAIGTSVHPLRLDATLPKITSTGLALRARGVAEDWVSIGSATVADTRISLQKSEIAIGDVQASGVQAQAWLEADGRLNIERLFAPPPAPGATSATRGPRRVKAVWRPWNVRVATFGLQDGTLRLEDRTLSPAPVFVLAPLAATATDLSQDLGKPVAVTVTATINGKAPLTLAGTVVPDTASADVQLTVAQMPVADLLAYLPDYPSTELRSGTADARGRVVLAPADAPGPELAFTGDAAISRFEMVERKGRRDFLAWERAEMQGVSFAVAPMDIRVQRITARKPFMRVVIAPDQTINLVSMFASATTATAQSGAKDAATDLPVEVGELVLDNATMNFTDLSIDPTFQARIEALRGKVLGLSTRTDSVAKIKLDGHVINRFSPVTITGETNPLAYDRHTDIRMAFKNIELPIFNPYSGRYAGYAIAKGKLSTEVHYRIDNRKLVADHHVVVDQLQWGAASGSKDKVSLPVRLATSLLKDRNGVIDLKLPVTGSLDDPKFRIGPIVWQIIQNVIVKVVSAPFTFLGAMFKGAEDAQYVDFAPGSAALPDKARSALPELAKGLADRAEVGIDIPAGPAIDADAAALAEQRFLAAIAALDKGGNGDAAAYASLDDEDRIDLLKDLYKQQFGKKPDLPEADAVVAAADATEAKPDPSRKERKAARRAADVAWLEGQLRPRFQATPAELRDLGQARATAVQEALLAGGQLDPTRVFLATQLPVVSTDGVVRMELALK